MPFFQQAMVQGPSAPDGASEAEGKGSPQDELREGGPSFFQASVTSISTSNSIRHLTNSFATCTLVFRYQLLNGPFSAVSTPPIESAVYSAHFFNI